MIEKSDLLENLANVVEIEEMIPVYFNEEALVESPQQVFRMNVSGDRYYYTFPDEYSEPEFFVSVTTFIRQTLPTSHYLIKWIADMGYEESQAYAAERAKYGTFMHGEIASFLINGFYDLDQLKGRLKTYIESEQLPATFIHHADELKKDMLAFAQWCIDVRLKPLAIEVILTHPTDGYAGAIDLVAELDGEIKDFHGEVFKSGVKKGQPRMTKKTMRVRGIIDFKSGRKGFYESSEIQLAAYREMWNKRFPDYPANYIFNWSPKDWRGSVPTYNFEDQTTSKSIQKLPHLVQLARIENSDMDNTVVACYGKISLEAATLDEHIKELTLSELVRSKKKSDETPIETEELSISEIAGQRASEIAKSESKVDSGVNISTEKESAAKPIKTARKDPKDLGI